MAGKREKPEDIVSKLRQVEVLQGQGMTIGRPSHGATAKGHQCVWRNGNERTDWLFKSATPFRVRRNGVMLCKLNFPTKLPTRTFIFAVLAVWNCQHVANSSQAYQIERVSFPTNVVPKTTNSAAINVPAQLYLPTKAALPLSAVVIVPSSGGVEQVREIYYAIELVKAGMAALIVDSFTARNINNTIYDQSKLGSWNMENDAIAALRYLSLDKRIKSDRVAVLGVSKGGTVAMDTSIAVRRRWMKIEKPTFAAHVAISPDCNWTTRSNETTGAPIFFVLAEHDNQTPIGPCLTKAARIRERGNRQVRTKVFAGAHHAWEELGAKPYTDPKAENYSKCRVWIEDDGSMHDDVTGELVPEDEWHGWAKKNCMTLGTICCGGTRKLKQEAARDIIAFLRDAGF
jgi:dienelactone hydrolase